MVSNSTALSYNVVVQPSGFLTALVCTQISFNRPVLTQISCQFTCNVLGFLAFFFHVESFKTGGCCEHYNLRRVLADKLSFRLR